jgi:hypothetical protein
MGWSVVLFLTLSATWHAPGASVKRYALLMASNRGAPEEPVLRYAHADVDRVARTLVEVAGVPAEHVTALKEASAEDVRNTFRAMRRRLGDDNTEGESILFVYYSGHADAAALHLGRTALPWTELLRLTREVDTTVRVMVIDACRAGALTELKGLTHDVPVELPQEGVPKGLAIITSAAAGEAAQESSDLQGSFFTQHFVAGLRGAADSNQDGRVTLHEAFEYASSHTSQSTASTLHGTQHAAYRFALRGRHELVLATRQELGSAQAIRLTQPGIYSFFAGGREGPLVLEASIDGGGRSILLPIGTYHVQRRAAARLFSGRLVVDADEPRGGLKLALADDGEAIASVGKGPLEVETTGALTDPVGERKRVWRLEALAGSGDTLLPHFETPLELGVGVSYRGRSWVADAQGFYRHGEAKTALLDTQQDEIGAAVGARYVLLEGEVFDLAAGGRLGAIYLAQRFDAASGFPAATQLVPMGQVLLRGEARLGGAFFIGCEVSARMTAYRALAPQNSPAPPPGTHAAIIPTGVIAVGASW